MTRQRESGAVFLALLLTILYAANTAFAQETGGNWVLLDAASTTLVKRGTDAMYNLRYNEADSIFTQLVQLRPEHPAGYFLLALVDWWRITPNQSVGSKVDRYSESFNSRIDKTIEICDKMLEQNPNDIVGLFFKGSALGYRARLKVENFSGTSILDWVSAASEGKDAYDIIQRCQRLAPSNSDILLGSGLYNYLGAYIPEKYPIAKNAVGFLPPGDKKIGLSMLRIAGKRAQYAATEAKYSLLEILVTMENDFAGAIQVGEELHTQYPSNPVFERFLAKAYYMNSDWLHADTLYVDLLTRVKNRQSGYELSSARQALYYLGDIRVRRHMPDDALRFLQEADKISRRFGEEESGWNILSQLKMGFAYDLLGKRQEALAQYKKVLDMDDYGNSHQMAQKYMGQPYN
ncbi:MAG: tetratricopeptide repeat protein [Bacteroidetes bacterium]|nr:tetratricopeptide repeat protein [Bacteroidota bacterium]